MQIPAPNTMIDANAVSRGMVIDATIETVNGGIVSYVVEVEKIVEGDGTWTFDNGYGRKVTVPADGQVRVLGYFNPE